jgi:hypothetical protein
MALPLEQTRDAATLQAVAAGVEQLYATMLALQREVGARQRGFLLPDEDDAVRRLFLAYRNSRVALLDIIARHQHFATEADEAERHRGFLLAFAAAAQLYDWSSTLVHTYRDVPTIRAKLNEPDQRFGIEADLFERIYQSLTSLNNLTRLRDATAFFELHQPALTATAAASGPPFPWLIAAAASRLPLLKRHDLDLLRDRVARGWNDWRRLTVRPFREVGYSLTTLFMDLVGNIWLDHIPHLPPSHHELLRQTLQPGDFLVVRPERKSSTVLLPGWWTHCAFYHGGPAALTACGAAALPHVKRAWPALLEGEEEQQTRVVLEALAAGVVLNPLQRSLRVDHVLAVRPRLGDADRLAALDDAFSHLGKPYDFDFDFSRSDRLVCTGVIYRTLHGKGPIRFQPVSRYGRPTLSADDIVDAILAGQQQPEPPFEVLALSKRHLATGRSRWYTGAHALRMLRAIHDLG